MDRLPTNINLEWGVTEFGLLGLEYSIYLNEMIEINYNLAISKIKTAITHWNRRFLTPLGKITVIKTFLVSKLNHLFLALPFPNSGKIKQINDLFCSFLWGKGPGKIKREIICQNYKNGGLKMIEISSFIKGLKITWLRRLLQAHESPCLLFFESQVISTKN